MAMTFIITGLLTLSNRALYIPSGKVIFGAFVTGVSLSTHVDSYIYKILGDSFYEYGFFEYLNVIWSSIFTSYPVGCEELYGSKRFFIIALAVTIIFIIIDLVRGVDATPTKANNRNASSFVNDNEHFHKNLAILSKGFNPITQENGPQYDQAQDQLAYYCAKEIYEGTASTAVRDFVYGDAEYYVCIEYVGWDPKYENVTGGNFYRRTEKNLYEYINEILHDYYYRKW